jgi:6-phosphogluconate dehydrogenase
LHKLAKKELQKKGCIIACSALKQQYRDRLSDGIEHNSIFILLNASFEVIHERTQKRKNHFMPISLLRSQFEILEVPKNALLVPATLSPQEIIKNIEDYLNNRGCL